MRALLVRIFGEGPEVWGLMKDYDAPGTADGGGRLLDLTGKLAPRRGRTPVSRSSMSPMNSIRSDRRRPARVEPVENRSTQKKGQPPGED